MTPPVCGVRRNPSRLSSGSQLSRTEADATIVAPSVAASIRIVWRGRVGVGSAHLVGGNAGRRALPRACLGCSPPELWFRRGEQGGGELWGARGQESLFKSSRESGSRTPPPGTPDAATAPPPPPSPRGGPRSPPSFRLRGTNARGVPHGAPLTPCTPPPPTRGPCPPAPPRGAHQLLLPRLLPGPSPARGGGRPRAGRPPGHGRRTRGRGRGRGPRRRPPAEHHRVGRARPGC